MATRTGSNRRSAIVGAMAMLLLIVLAVAIVVFGGLYPVAASKSDPPGVGWLLEESMEHGVKAGAKGLKAPQFSRADIREGGSHFKGMCQSCHGGPGAEPAEFASGMNPRPPNLAEAAGEWSVPEIFWIAKNGIKMSAMPAFGKTDEDEELWKVAAFVKQLPKVSAADYASLPNAHEHGEHAHKDGDNHEHSH